jgi:hypothetical protein
MRMCSLVVALSLALLVVGCAEEKGKKSDKGSPTKQDGGKADKEKKPDGGSDSR